MCVKQSKTSDGYRWGRPNKSFSALPILVPLPLNSDARPTHWILHHRLISTQMHSTEYRSRLGFLLKSSTTRAVWEKTKQWMGADWVASVLLTFLISYWWNIVLSIKQNVNFVCLYIFYLICLLCIFIYYYMKSKCILLLPILVLHSTRMTFLRG